MQKVLCKISLIVVIAIMMSCGDVTVNVDQSQYNPKIVVDGCLQPFNNVSDIRITRNYPLDTEILVNEIILDDAILSIKDVEADTLFQLEYSSATMAYEYIGSNLIIDYGAQYTLFVEATIDGKRLTASSTTTIPLKGFEIVEDECTLEPLTYRERDENNELKKYTIAFKRSPDIDSYIVSIVALEGSRETFIEDNIFEINVDDLDENNLLSELQYGVYWTQTQLGGESLSTVDIEWFSIWFYGKYRVIVYAADKNLNDYFLTHRFIQDIDGNLWEPKLHFEGDAIGVFGSAITDTVYFEVLRQ